MFEWLRLKFEKAETLSRIVVGATTDKNRSSHDFLAQEEIKQAMKDAGYTYVGEAGAADAEQPGSYRPSFPSERS